VKKIVASAIYLVLSLLMLAYSVYAWFTNRVAVTNIIIKTGNIDVEAELYIGQDYDYDGVVDIDENGDEIYLPLNNYKTQGEPLQLVSGLNPGDIVSFKLWIKNVGTIDGMLGVYFGGFDGGLKDVMTLYSVNGTKTGDNGGYIGGFSERELIYSAPEKLRPEQESEVYFQLKFASLDELKALNPDTFSQYSHLNDYKSGEGAEKTFFMNIIVELRTLSE
jgi:hypothetical protein